MFDDVIRMFHSFLTSHNPSQHLISQQLNLDPSDGMKHAAHFNAFLLGLANEQRADSTKPLPYLVLIECDGGPDHNLTFLFNQLALFGLFLVGNMDKLNATRGTPGLSYLNTAERPMSNLNRGLSSLALRLNPDRPDWLLDLLSGVSSMKGIRRILAEYDNIMEHAIDALERRQSRQMPPINEGDDESTDGDAETNNTEVAGGDGDAEASRLAKVGDTIYRFFPLFG